jgi:hypothetical protein
MGKAPFTSSRPSNRSPSRAEGLPGRWQLALRVAVRAADPSTRQGDMLRCIARMRSEVGDTLSGPTQPVSTGRLARTALLVVLIVLALGPSVIDSRIMAGSIPATLATLASVFCVALSRSAIPSLRATGR